MTETVVAHDLYGEIREEHYADSLTAWRRARRLEAHPGTGRVYVKTGGWSYNVKGVNK